MITISNLYHQYSKSQNPVLNNINLSIAQGETLGLLGPNGAGKTTLMSLLAGLLSKQQGEILFDGIPFEQLTRVQRQKISLVPQDFAFYPQLSVWDNLIFFASLYNIKNKSYLIKLLEKTGLENYQKTLAKNLSGGLKRRLNFSIGLINQPELIFLDEITVGIDPKSRQFILESVAELSRRGITVIYTSHYLQEIEQLCQNIVLLNEGDLIYQGSIAQILKQSQFNSLEHFYLDFLKKDIKC